MYIQFSDRLNAQTNSIGVRPRFSGRLTAWRQFLVRQYNRRRADRQLAVLDGRLLLDCAAAEASSCGASRLTSRDPGCHAFNMQLLRLP